MSENNHPNINAVGWTAEIIDSFQKYLRNKAAKAIPISINVLDKYIVDFVTQVSTDLDLAFSRKHEEFGTFNHVYESRWGSHFISSSGVHVSIHTGVGEVHEDGRMKFQSTDEIGEDVTKFLKDYYGITESSCQTTTKEQK